MAGWRWTLGLTAGMVALALFGAGCDRNDRPGQLGKLAPQFMVSDGKSSVDLSQLRGHVVLLNFWASWCAPCLEELPSMNALQQQMPEIRVVGISMDQDSEAYALFLQQHPVSFMTVLDPAQRSNALYGGFRPPESYVIDKRGYVRRKFIGAQDWTSQDLVKSLRKMVAE